MGGGPVGPTVKTLLGATLDHLSQTPDTALDNVYFLAYTDAEYSAFVHTIGSSPWLSPQPRRHWPMVESSRARTEPNAHRDVVVILTALGLEYDTVLAHLTGAKTQIYRGTRFEVGMLADCPWPIALAMTGVGNTSAAVIVERAISLFEPKALLFVGIAGRLADDIALGDIVVSTWVYAYQGGRDENEFRAYPRAWEASHYLEQLARHVDRSRSWTRLLPDNSRQRPPMVHFRPVAAGDAVLNSAESHLIQLIRRHYSDAAAVEMESAGVAQAAHLNSSLPVLIVRGISDAASGDKDATDRAGWQPTAAAHAAAFALALVSRLAADAGAQHPATEPLRAWSTTGGERGPAEPSGNSLVAPAKRRRGWRRFTMLMRGPGLPTRRLRRWAATAAVLTVVLGLVLVQVLDRDPPDDRFQRGDVTAPFTPRRLADPSQPPPATEEERTVELFIDKPGSRTVRIDWWRARLDSRNEPEPGDLRIDEKYLYTLESVGITLLPGSEPASFARCTAPGLSWTHGILLADLKRGSQLCGYSTGDRYAMLAVISVPSAGDRRLVFFGRTWKPSWR